METITAAFVRQCLPRRDPEGHKGDFGKVLCICGSVGYTGAPIFASRAAVRTGAGLVLLGVPQSVWPVAAVKSDEAMPFPLPETADGKLSLLAEEPIRQRAAGCDAVLLGCGLGRDWQTDTLVQDLLNMEKPLVLDADGLNAISENAELLQKREISARVVKINAISPLYDRDMRAIVGKTRALLVAEECAGVGCMGQRMAAILDWNRIAPERLELCNLGKAFPAQGTLEDLQREFGLDAESLANKAAEVLR